jgi:hypothetical protein
VLIACWSPKGGTGTTVVTAALACRLSAPGHRGSGGGALAVDLAGDLPAALGLAEVDGAGVAEWLAAAPDVAADGLARLERPVTAGLGLVGRGRGALLAGPADALAGLLAADPRPVVADCGVLRPDDPAGAATVLAAGATRSLVVLRACFLSLRRALDAPVRPSGVVLMVEEGRALDVDDVEAALGVPVVARVRVTEAVARAVDAGLLAHRLPRTLDRDLRRAA